MNRALLLAASACLLLACNQSEITAEDIAEANRAGESVATWKAKEPIRRQREQPVPGELCSDQRFNYLNRVDGERLMTEFKECLYYAKHPAALAARRAQEKKEVTR
jgi:hypothetical protein